MNTADWAKLKEWFGEALEAPERIPQLLDAATRESPALASELQSLFAEHASRGFDTSAVMAGASALRAGQSEDAGADEVGPYRIVGELGRGGTGLVLLAERTDDEFHRRVALKVLRFAGWDRRSLDLLTQERSVLVQLQHPNIAALLDWGNTPEGAPWLATEYIEGQPIDEYCRMHAREVPATLDVFAQLCEAVQYAHRRLLVHRDLKPANILVTGAGLVKLLDFGISKPLTDATVTQTSERRFTPAYASPEQIQGRRVTAASDIYALGLLLYELLAGTLPFDPESIQSLARRLDDADFAPPSAASGLSHVRRRALRGDLDRIALHALERDPERRYQSVEQLIADLDRYRGGYPISVRRPSVTYRAGKFVRRHTGSVMLGAVAVVALVTGSGAAVWSARVAREEQRVAEKRFKDLREFAHSVMFDLHDGIRIVPGTVAARQQLITMAVKYLDGLQAEHIADDALQLELAGGYARIGYIQGGRMGVNLGNTPGSMKSYRAALRILDDLWRRRPDDDRIGALRFGAAYHLSLMINDPAEALAFASPYAHEADAWLERTASGASLHMSSLMHAALGRMHRASGAFDASLHELDITMDRQRRYLPISRPDADPGPMFGASENRGQTLFESALAQFARAETLLDLQRPADALAAMKDAKASLDQSTAIRGGPSNDRMVARIHGLTAHLLLQLGRVEEALVEAEKEMRAAVTNAGDGSATGQRDLAEAHRHSGNIRFARGDVRSAVDHLQSAAAIIEKVNDLDPTFLVNRALLIGILNDYGRVLTAAKQPDAAREMLHRALDLADGAIELAPSAVQLTRERARALAPSHNRSLSAPGQLTRRTQHP